MKSECFGFWFSNQNYIDINCIPQMHWPGGKEEQVTYILDHSIHISKSRSQFPVGVRKVFMHADNCGGQEQNHYILWFSLWMVNVQLEDEISSNFLVAGHTNNWCDSEFGFAKRRLQKQNVVTPREIMIVVDKRSPSNQFICSVDVRWICCKIMLYNVYIVPASFMITRYHLFWFQNDNSNCISVKLFSSYTVLSEICFIKQGVTAVNVRKFTVYAFSKAGLGKPTVPLSEVPS